MDFSDLIYQSFSYLIIGLLLLFSIAYINTHLIVSIQKKILTNEIPKKAPYTSYLKHLFSDFFSKPSLILTSFYYIFSTRNKKWKSIGIVQIDAVVYFFRTIIFFLKPYIICAIIFGVIKFFIYKQLLIAELTPILANVDQAVNYLKSSVILSWIMAYRSLFFLILGLTSICILYLFSQKKKLPYSGKTFKKALIYLAILGNISFFSINLGKFTKERTNQYATLSATIVKPHLEIFVKAIKLGEENVLTTEILDDDHEQNESLRALEKEHIKKSERIIVTNEIQEEFSANLKTLTDNESKKEALLLWKPPAISFPEITLKLFDELHQIVGTTSTQENTTSKNDFDYLFDKDNWTEAKGKELNKQLDEVIAQHKVADKQSFATFELLYDFILSSVLNSLTDWLAIEQQRTVKKVILALNNPEAKQKIFKNGITILKNIFHPKKAKDISDNLENISIDKSVDDKKFTDFKDRVDKIWDRFLKRDIKKLNADFYTKIEKEVVKDVREKFPKLVGSASSKDKKFNDYEIIEANRPLINYIHNSIRGQTERSGKNYNKTIKSFIKYGFPKEIYIKAFTEKKYVLKCPCS